MSGQQVTARIVCQTIQTFSQTQHQVRFTPDYAMGRNAEWAEATPALNLEMTVKDPDLFRTGQAYELTFTETEEGSNL